MVQDKLNYKTEWVITKYADDEAYQNGQPYATSRIEGNLLLNSGIALLWDLGIAAGGTAWNNANAALGVGDSNTAEAAAQTDLQAATNKLYKAMSATYPQRASQTVTWRAAFDGTSANYAWNEFVLRNGLASGTCLNRKVSAQGTKTSGQTWTLDLSITLS